MPTSISVNVSYPFVWSLICQFIVVKMKWSEVWSWGSVFDIQIVTWSHRMSKKWRHSSWLQSRQHSLADIPKVTLSLYLIHTKGYISYFALNRSWVTIYHLNPPGPPKMQNNILPYSPYVYSYLSYYARWAGEKDDMRPSWAQYPLLYKVSYLLCGRRESSSSSKTERGWFLIHKYLFLRVTALNIMAF